MGWIFGLPVAVAIILAVGWASYEAVTWAQASAAACQELGLGDWPWNLPGAYWAMQAFDYMAVAFAAEPVSTAYSANLHSIKLMGYFPLMLSVASLGVFINVSLVLFPLFLVNNAWRWLKNAKSKVRVGQA